jgi:phytanoyl-CoA hydroxylase
MEESLNQYEWDTEVAPHEPDLYDYSSIAEGVSGFAAIDDAAIARYHEEGFLVVHQAFTLAEVQAAIDGLTDLVAGKNPDFHVIQYHTSVRDRLHLMTTEERFDHIRKLGTFTEYDARLKAMAFHPQLVAVLRRLLEAEPELYQSMALIKPPRGREKPWHQDHAYFDLTLETKVVGVWIALDAATTENGCMRVMPGWHKRGPFMHFQIRDWQLCDDQSQSFKAHCAAVPLAPGGCLFFDSLLPHGTPSNDSQLRRKALQYHYLPAGIPRTPPEARLAIFGSEGKDVAC